MKIGIMTFWWTQSNYGQMLQAFALKTTLEKLGHEPFLIKYHGSAASQKSKKTVLERFIAFNLKDFVDRRVKQYRLRKELKENLRDFDGFRSAHFNFSSESYSSLDELLTSPPIADAYICGSDQVWNSNFGVSCEPYLLGFGDRSIKRIAYAASFGVKHISNETEQIFRKHLPSFDVIGVREISGVELCHRMGFSNAKLLPDPTLLLTANEWCKIIGTDRCIAKTDKYMIYTLGNSPMSDKEKFLNFIHKSGKTVNHVSSNYDFTGNKFPKVFEWVQMVNQSDFILTNSFHGMVFCLIFNKNFVIIPNTGSAEGMNERITSLLERLGLLDNIMSSFDNSKLQILIDKKIDWASINQMIADWKIDAETTLLSSLT